MESYLICRTTGQGLAIWTERNSKNASFMTFEKSAQGTRLSIIDVDVVVIATGQNLVCVKLKASNNVTVMCSKRNMMWLRIF